MKTPNTRYKRAKSLALAASFALTINLTSALANTTTSAVGLADAARAAEELRPHQTVRLITYQPTDGPMQAAVFYRVGAYTFGYARERGSKYLAAPLDESPSHLATAWCHRPVLYAREQGVPAIRAIGQCANGCLIDALVHFFEITGSDADANWEGVFLLRSGPMQIGGDHAVLIYLRGELAWLYDPCGERTVCLGRVNLNCPGDIAQRIQPEANSGGWLVSRDLAWMRRHGVALE